MSRPPACLPEVLAVLLEERSGLSERGGVRLIGVVGSLARGDARPGSDVDIVFDPEPGFDYWRLGALVSELRERSGRPVDLVDRQMMTPERWVWTARDLIPLA